MPTVSRPAVVRRSLAAVVLVHGLIHLLGVVKGYGWAQVPQLTHEITPAGATAWLLATLLVVGAGVMLGTRSRYWWQVSAVAAVGSQAVILTSWNDARTGTLVNVVMLLAAGYGYVAQGPRSFAAEYRRRVADATTDPAPVAVVSEDDLAGLPQLVADYVRRSGAVGRPRVGDFRAVIRGRIRAATDKPWMEFTGEQFNTYGPDPRRLFHINATMFGVPMDILHVFADGAATMRGRVGYLLPILAAAGPEMDRAETVTLFNDMCILAPAALVDAPVTWQSLDADRVAGAFTLGAHTVTAELVFDDDHDLVDFVSEDRLRSSADGKTFTRQRWSTPIGGYREAGTRRLAATGEGRWHAPQPEGEFAYLEFHLDDISYNTTAATCPPGRQDTSASLPDPASAP